MRRFFSPSLKDIYRNQEIIKLDYDAHHLIDVLRVSVNERIELTNGQGLLLKARVSQIVKKEIFVEVISFEQEKKPSSKIILACAIPKKNKIDDIIEKSVELGVDVIIPIITQRTENVPRLEQATRKENRFFKIAIEAMKQSKRSFLPEIFSPMDFQKAIQWCAEQEIKIFIPWLGADEGQSSELLQKVLAQENNSSSVAFFIGPEGDFTPDEVIWAQKHKAIPVSLGGSVLKVDTACYYCLSLYRGR